MKKTTLALALALAGVTSMASAAPQSNAFYMGAKLGWTKFFNTHSDYVYDAKLAAPAKTENDGVSTNNVGAGIYGGYQVNPYAAIELGYDYLGRAKYKVGPNGDNARVSAMGVQLSLKANYPLEFITPDLDIYARGGLMVTRTKWTQSMDDVSNTKTDVAPVFALGFDYKLNETLSTRLEYQWVQGMGVNSNVGENDNYNIRPDNGMLSLGVTYSFGALVKDAPKAIEVPAEAVVLETKVYDLTEDVLFAFGKDTLKPEGKQALNALISNLTNINATDGSAVITGHTDRIGSKSFNLKLSQKRADTVKAYLVSQGVPADAIVTRGVGSAEPVTGTTCDKVTARNELIACLAPDRRVVIEVTAEAQEAVIIK